MKHCTQCGAKLGSKDEYCGNCGHKISSEIVVDEVPKNTPEETSTEPVQEPVSDGHKRFEPFFTLSTSRLIVASILTLGIYELYWFYCNWRSYKYRDDAKVSPFWRAFFPIFFTYSLFKRTLKSAEETNYPETFSPGFAALLYIVPTYFLALLPHPWWLLYFLSILGIIPVQNAMRYYNSVKYPHHREKSSFSTNEKFFLIIGGIVLARITWLILFPTKI